MRISNIPLMIKKYEEEKLKLGAELKNEENKLSQFQLSNSSLQSKLKYTQKKLKLAKREESTLLSQKPNWLSRILRRKSYSSWNAKFKNASNDVLAIEATNAKNKSEISSNQRAMEQIKTLIASRNNALEAKSTICDNLYKEISVFKSENEGLIIDEKSVSYTHLTLPTICSV